MDDTNASIVVTPDEVDALIARAIDEGWTELVLLGPRTDDAAFLRRAPHGQVHRLTERVDDLAARVSESTTLRHLTLVRLRIDAEDARHLAALTNLTSLDLSHNNVGDEGARHLAALANLSSLRLSSNNIGDEGARHLAALANLDSLYLSGNNVSDKGARHLAVLANLDSLYLSGNNVGDEGARHLAALTNLTSLRLSYNSVGDGGARHLAAYSNLNSLNLNGNRIGNEGATHLATLVNLTWLHLSGNRIGDEGAKHLAALTNLDLLYLGGNPIGDEGARHLAALTNLNALALSGNSVGGEGARHLAVLTNLTSLRLSNSSIGDEGARHLAALANLTSLHLSNSSIGDEGARHLAALANLNSLHLSNNSIGNEGARHLAALANLNSLHLSNNSVGDEGARHLAALSNLTSLGLGETGITDLSPLRDHIARGMPVSWRSSAGTGLMVKDCPLKHPPPEVAKAGRDAVLNYFAELEAQGTERLYEAKLLLVGEGRAGKTSLLRRLYRSDLPLPAEEETTKGIDIHVQGFPMQDGQPFRLNVWDFGGQEIYHATHQFFLTRRSLYVLLDDTAKDDHAVHDPGFRYWLEVVDRLSGSSPILIFQNEKGGRSKSIDLAGIKGRFPNVVDVYRGDLRETGAADAVREAIHLHAQRLPHIADELPAKWVAIRADIEARATRDAYISEEAYFDIYRAHLDFDRDKARHLSRYLHDLGVFLHFQDHPLLRRTVVLQNEWATDAVFHVLDDEHTKRALGRFSKNDCEAIWGEPRYADMHDELLAMMERFELCYPLPDAEPATWLAPQLLPPSMPEALTGWARAHDLALTYRYRFLPKGLVSRLIVRMHRHLAGPDLAWTGGALFERGDTTLLVRITESDEIALRARGPESKALLSVITSDLDTLNESFGRAEDLVEKLVPCICSLCSRSAQPAFYEERRLRKRRQARPPTISCDESFEDVPVHALLDGLRLDDRPAWATTTPEEPDTEVPRSAETPVEAPPAFREVSVFLASSKELAADRDAFDLHFRQKNDRLTKEGLYLRIVRWENFVDAVSETRLQNEYNAAIRNCGIFVCLLSSKAGRYTVEEFDVAREQFLQSGARPLVYTYFKKTQVEASRAGLEALESLVAFQERLAALGHFYTEYDGIEHLKRQFSDQLDMLRDEGRLPLDPRA